MTRAILSLCVAACLLYLTSAQSATADPITEDPGFHLNPRVIERRTDSMILVWDEPHGGVLGYKIQLDKSDSDDIITSPELGPLLLEYKLENLIVESEYQICLKAATSDVKQSTDSLVFNEERCIVATTIDSIRRDSIVALCIALGYIVAMAIIGYICWAIAKRRIDAKIAAREEELLAEEEPEEEKAPVRVNLPTPPVKRVTYGIPKTPEPPREKTPVLTTPEAPDITAEIVSEVESVPRKSVTPEPKPQEVEEVASPPKSVTPERTPEPTPHVPEEEPIQPKSLSLEPTPEPACEPEPEHDVGAEAAALPREPSPEPVIEPSQEPTLATPERSQPPISATPEPVLPPKPATPEPAPAPRLLVAKPPRPPSPPMTSSPKSESPQFRRLQAKPKLAPLASMEDSMDDLMELCEPSYP